MKFYMLSRINGVDYDQYDAFVVRAKNAKSAREIASKDTSGEDSKAWLSDKESSCNELNLKGREKIIIGSFNAA